MVQALQFTLWNLVYLFHYIILFTQSSFVALVSQTSPATPSIAYFLVGASYNITQIHFFYGSILRFILQIEQKWNHFETVFYAKTILNFELSIWTTSKRKYNTRRRCSHFEHGKIIWNREELSHVLIEMSIRVSYKSVSETDRKRLLDAQKTGKDFFAVATVLGVKAGIG